MIKVSRSNTNWLTKGETIIGLPQAAEILVEFLEWLDRPVYHTNIYVERRKITFTAIQIRPRNGPQRSTKFEGSVSEIKELAGLLPRSDRVKYHPNFAETLKARA